jgi:hypothetical protein
MPGIPIPRSISHGVRDTPPKPAETKTVNPLRNPRLVAREKGDSCADAMDGRPVAEILFEIKA